MYKRLALSLFAALSLGLVLSEGALAQRGRPSGGGSRPSATPSRPSSRPSSTPSRPSSRPSSTPSRPSSRPSATPSRPSSRPISTPRPSSTPSRVVSPRPSSSRPGSTRFVTPSPSPTPTRAADATPDRSRGGSSGATSGTGPVDRGPSAVRTGEATAPRAPVDPRNTWRPSTSSSTPLGTDSAGRATGGPTVIDVTSAALPPRVRFPSAYSGSREVGTGLSGRLSGARASSPGSGRTGAATTRSRVDGPASNRAAEQLAARRAERMRQRDLSTRDVLDRYPGDRSAPAADRTSAFDARRMDAARAAAAADGVRPLSGRARGDDARSVDAPSDRGRGAGTEPAPASDGQRIAAARAQQQLSDAERMRNARADYQKAIGARTDALGLEGRPRGGSITGGAGYDAGYGDGYVDGFYDGTAYVNNCFWGNWYNGYSWCWSPCFYASSYWWNCWWWSGCSYRWNWYPRYYWYGPFIPWSYSYVQTVVEREVVYVEQQPVEVLPEGEAVARRGEPAADPLVGMSLDRAADHFLALGDEAFRDGRYADAVHHYAKAVEYAPDEGVLWLILSDALFATGDYHYAAFALRKALSLDPELAENVVDKHEFYADPAAFDRQLAVLERYLEDHFLDHDARLLLAANYLFGGRPAAAVDLLENPFSLEVKQSLAGALILESARAVQFGPVAPELVPTGGR